MMAAPTLCRINVPRTQQPLADRARWATSLVQRMVGLLNRRGLAPGEALILAPCQAIHMCFMRFAIDAVFVDRAWRVVAVLPQLRPWQWSPWVPAAWAVIELPAGAAARSGVVVGDTLSLRSGAA